jgi:hypothetical protein
MDTTPSSADSGFIEPTLERVIEVWWAWFWRASLLGFAGSSCIVVLFVFIMAAVHGHVPAPIPTTPRPSPNFRLITMVPIFLITAAAQVWAFQMVLKKTLKRFSIRLVKNPS